MYKHLLFLLLLCSSISVNAQNTIGDWQNHYAFENGLQLAHNEDVLFCLSQSGLFSYSSQGEVSVYNKLNALSDDNISLIKWSDENNLLLIAYQNGNIDLLTARGVYNISDIKQFKDNIGKTINDVFFHGKYAYLACEFALVVVDLEKKELTDTYYIGPLGEKENIISVAISNGYIYAGSHDFLKRINLNNDNISDYRNWELIDSNNGSYIDILLSDSDVYFVKTKNSLSVDILKGPELKMIIFDIQGFSNIKFYDDTFYIIHNKGLSVYSYTGVKENSTNEFYLEGDLYETDFSDFAKWNSKMYFADGKHALLQQNDDSLNEINANGPISNDIIDMIFADDKIFTLLSESEKTYLNTYKNSYWSHGIEKQLGLQKGEHILSIIDDKANVNNIFIASNNSRLFSLQNDNIKTIDVPQVLKPMNISVMNTDKKGSLYLIDENENTTLKLRTADNKWYQLSYASIKNNSYKKIISLQTGDKWMLPREGNNLFAFNENNSLDNITDDAFRNFVPRDENSKMLANSVNDIIEDQDANVWLATDKGVLVYWQASRIFRDGDFYASRPILSAGGENHYLLGTEQVNSISVDGANRKWIGTQASGLFLISENGDEQLEHFNTLNSPLPSNNILETQVNNTTGELLIKTDRGLISYKTSVTEGENNFDELYVYPNPVRENYHADIVITGLMKGASVKITNISGQLVSEGFAQGGQFLWDGHNLNDNRVSTGVYLIFCSNEDGSESKIIKLLFIN